MSLTSDLISEFVKVTNDGKKEKKETTYYGTTVDYNGVIYVRLDGSELLTPISSTTDTLANERVIVKIKNHAATITGNLSSPAARTSDVSGLGYTISEFEIALGQKVDTVVLAAETARIDALVADNVSIKQNLSTVEADISDLEADNVTITDKLTAAEADIDILETTKLDVTIADATYATITDLEATDADIHNLEATYANISTLIFGSATGTTIQTSFANAVIAQLGNAQIKSAMIETVTANKITSGDINTNNVRVLSEDGKLLISDETIQISDETRVRVQIGKDASNDYSINIWDVEGNLMFSEGGITDSAIKDAIIRNDMVSDTANISAYKLDIDSLFEEINGSTNTIKSTQIYLDDMTQTLDIAFTEVTTDIEGLQSDMSSQGTEIEVIQGQITSKIWQQDITTAVDEVESKTDTLTTQYNTLIQTVDSNSVTIAEHTSTISDLGSRLTSAETSITQNASEINLRVTETERALDDLEVDADTALDVANSAQETADTAESLIRQLSDSIAMLVTDGNGTSLMTQTENGWTFSTSEIQAAVDATSEGLNALVDELGSTNGVVDVLQQAVTDLGVLADYIKIGTYEDEPCIELGESDSEFKLRITNTRMMFMEGSSVLAYFNNQSLYIKKAVVEEELQQGGFVWKARSNGNLGLIWKGGI